MIGFDSDLNDANLDLTLARLNGPTTAEERFEILQELVQYWHGPIGPQDGMKQDELGGLRLPLLLRRWYSWGGNREEILSGQNFLFSPKGGAQGFYKLSVEDDHLAFYIENQGVYQWATLPEGDDPPVFGRHDDGEAWQPEGITLSEHLIIACLVEAILCHSPFGASTAWLKEEKLQQIVGQRLRLSTLGWRWPGPSRFYAGGGVFMYVCAHQIRGEAGYSIWIGAKTEEPLQFLKPHIDKDWEYVAL